MKHTLTTVFAAIILCCSTAQAATDSLALRKEYYQSAKQELEDMLDGKQPLSFERAIFLIENAWWDNQFDYQAYSTVIGEYADQISKLYDKRHFKAKNPYKENSFESLSPSAKNWDAAVTSLQKNWAIYSYLKDTALTFREGRTIYSIHQTPYTYSFEDPLGTIDWKNTQVVNLLDRRRGNCFALAALYKILADRLGAEANLSTAPHHIYITHKNEQGIPYNVELSNGMFAGTGTLATLTYTTNDAIRNNIALRELDTKQSIALCLVYLGKGYEFKTGQHDDAFLLSCAEVALKHDPLNLNAMLLKAEVLEGIAKRKGLPVDKLKTDKSFIEYQSLVTRLYNLGYREMPVDMKNILIKGWTKDTLVYLAAKSNMPPAYNHSGVPNTRYASLSWGMFDEEIQYKPVERFGKTIYDVKQKKIIQFDDGEKLYNNYNFDPVVFAWNVDPLAHKLPGSSPYAFCLNNPILMFDPDGAFPYTVHIRSFHPNQLFGKLYKSAPSFHGDNRGFSISTAKDVTSRINHQFTFDVDKNSMSYNRTKDTWSNASFDDRGNTATATPRGHMSKMDKTGDKASFYTSYSANNPLVFGSPDIDVYAKFNVQEDKKNHLLNINMQAKGDDFPNTEAFITDASGQSVFLGVDVRRQGKDNSPMLLFGGYEEDIMDVNISVGFDDNGNFTNVNSGGKTYTLSDWNAKFQNTSAQPSDKQ